MGIFDFAKKQNKKTDVVVSPESIICPVCKKEIFKEEAKQMKYICPECNYYFRVRANNRIRMVVDEGSFEAWFEDIRTENPLKDVDDIEKNVYAKVFANEIPVINVKDYAGEARAAAATLAFAHASLTLAGELGTSQDAYLMKDGNAIPLG